MPGDSIYALDTNVLMDWQARHYPTDIFNSLIDKIDTLISAGRLYSPTLVKEELISVGTNELHDWADSRKAIWTPNQKLLAAALNIQKRFPGLLDPKATHEEADAYVIALAQLHGEKGIVVTQETSAAEKRSPKRPLFMPDVCRELGIHCISLQGLMRREKWVF
jgi:predicted nucleic acid-binding protein